MLLKMAKKRQRRKAMRMKLNQEVYRCAARLIACGYCFYCHTAIAEANDMTFFRSMYHELFNIIFGQEQFRMAITEKNQLARCIALDLAALIAEEGEFNPEEWGR
jgi:hypothetical protein